MHTDNQSQQRQENPHKSEASLINICEFIRTQLQSEILVSHKQTHPQLRDD